MVHSDRSDADLVRLAQNGESRAFAVLLYRHGPAVRACVDADRDPTGAVIATFVAAMRRLRHLPPDDPVRPWLLQLAAKRTRRPNLEMADDVPPLDADVADEIWAELDLRWPGGRVPRSVPRWVGWAALLVVLVSLAVVVPYLLLTVETGPDEDVELVELVARPFDEEIEREPAEELFESNGDSLLDELPGLDTGEVTDAPADEPVQEAPTPEPTPETDQTPDTSEPAPVQPTPPVETEPEQPANPPPAPAPPTSTPPTLDPPDEPDEEDPDEEDPDPPDDPVDPDGNP